MQRQCRAGTVFFAGAMALLSTGCPRSKPAAPPRPAPKWAGVTVRVAAPPGPAALLLARHGAAWAKAAGATLAVAPPAGDWPAADLVLMPPAELPRWAAAGKARPLPQPDEAAVLMPLYRVWLLRWEGTAFGLPVLGDGPVCLARTEVYADPATRRAFEERHQRPLHPPETWDDFADQAAFFAARR
jgi:hypothetical protein